MSRSHRPVPSLALDCPMLADDLSSMIVGSSAAAARLRRTVCRLARYDAPVLLTGPSGSGKEVAARALHQCGPRRQRPFVALNCAAIPAELIESELFGHERGAFTGAGDRRIGLFELAGDGILFLDEIGDMPAAAQVRLLRVLEQRCFRRVGGTAEIPFRAQVICATHCDLDAAVAAGRFRSDLWYRIAVLIIRVAPLSERTGDIADLVSHIAADLGLSVAFTPQALALLACHDWPGNIRELRNVAIRAATLYPDRPVPAYAIGGLIHAADDWSDAGRTHDAGNDGLDAIMRAVEVHQLRRALAAHDGVIARAARALGINRTTLVEKMRRHGLSRWPDHHPAMPPD